VRVQIGYWTDSMALWSRTLEATEDNAIAHYSYGCLLAIQGKHPESLVHLDRAEQLQPGLLPFARARVSTLIALRRFDEAERIALDAIPRAEGDAESLGFFWFQLGFISQSRGHTEEGAVRYLRSLRYDPRKTESMYHCALLLDALGRTDEAVRVLAPAAELVPNNPKVAARLGLLHLKRHQFAEAVPPLRRASELEPEDTTHRVRLALALYGAGGRSEAVALARKLAQNDPQWVAGGARQAWGLATSAEASHRDGITAVQLAELLYACVGRPDPVLLDVLAAAYAETGRFDEAATVADRSAEAAERAKQPTAGAIRARAEGYRKRQPYRVP
jgi:tetratricopeptide (TPR) repeat protein